MVINRLIARTIPIAACCGVNRITATRTAAQANCPGPMVHRAITIDSGVKKANAFRARVMCGKPSTAAGVHGVHGVFAV